MPMASATMLEMNPRADDRHAASSATGTDVEPLPPHELSLASVSLPLAKGCCDQRFLRWPARTVSPWAPFSQSGENVGPWRRDVAILLSRSTGNKPIADSDTPVAWVLAGGYTWGWQPIRARDWRRRSRPPVNCAAIEGRLRHGGLAGVGEPARCLPNLALEVAGVEFGAPHHLVDPPQVADAERARLEGGGEGGFLEGRTQCFEGIVEDLGVVERQRHSAGKHIRDR